jgi:RecJ-like exonuclease
MAEDIFYVALGVSATGLLILAYFSCILEPPLCSIGDIDSNSIGRALHVRGMVSSMHRFEGGSAILTLRDGSGEIDVYIDYNAAKANPGILDAKVIDLVGEVDEYQGRLELKPLNHKSVSVLS